jgi:hypothetical protein
VSWFGVTQNGLTASLDFNYQLLSTYNCTYQHQENINLQEQDNVTEPDDAQM